MLKKKSIALLLSCLSYGLYAGSPFPRGCEASGFGFQDPYVTLNDIGSQMFFIIHNRSLEPIELERIAAQDAFMTPKLQAKLEGEQWAAFASDVSNTHFRCYKVTGNTTETTDQEQANNQPINCAEVLQICQYPRVRFALSNMGSYWVSTNKPLSQVIKDSTAKGIYLKW